ncbi:Rpn family recombination-promoting nuclease/putative transposase [[Clostridium] innocuum]|nr:Rpn family recombination-promoting nuclease/putative transposase [[Clostridium] innocuum]MCR0258942.1 Rpn family recombination-promoting nuclease/putative transposase [[Clostridium] innocuum]QSI26195.1 Rpn family recombination-promoting nuclease/putative transposase [Erysipelotrichaceae bacterium 66202529]
MTRKQPEDVLNYRNDLFFKYTLSREDEGSIFARNTIIERVTRIRVKESTVMNPNLDPKTIGKKKIILDVHVKDENNQLFCIEMQTTFTETELKRFEFYGARALNDQLNSGEKYELLKPVHQIIFIDEYPWNNRNLMNHYQMRTKKGEVENKKALIKRSYIHLPVINELVRKQGILKLNDFEQLCYLFENNENDAILKTKERLVKVFVEKYKEMQKNEKLWSTAMAIQMGEARYRNGLNDSFKEGLEQGIEKGLKEGEKKIQLLLNQLIEKKYHEDATAWLQTLTAKQITAISDLLFTCETLEDLKQQIKNA